jgi:hypothetical protein
MKSPAGSAEHGGAQRPETGRGRLFRLSRYVWRHNRGRWIGSGYGLRRRDLTRRRRCGRGPRHNGRATHGKWRTILVFESGTKRGREGRPRTFERLRAEARRRNRGPGRRLRLRALGLSWRNASDRDGWRFSNRLHRMRAGFECFGIALVRSRTGFRLGSCRCIGLHRGVNYCLRNFLLPNFALL